MKFKFVLPVLAIAAAISTPASAEFSVEGIGSTTAISSGNDFAGDLDSNYGLTAQTNDFSSILLLTPARITFYALASESGYTDSFSGYGVNGVESNFAFDTNRVLGSAIVADGVLGELQFTSNIGATATPGNGQFAVFLPTGFNGSMFKTDWLVFGYDDTLGGDADFDDFIIGAKISAIPEAHVWATMIVGFSLVGFQFRRSRKAGVALA